METDNVTDIPLDAMLENYIFYIFRMYEFSHSQDLIATSQSRISARGSVNAAGRRYAAPSIMTIIEMEGPLIGRWPTEGSLL